MSQNEYYMYKAVKKSLENAESCPNEQGIADTELNIILVEALNPDFLIRYNQEEEAKKHCYIGDGVYAEFDGYGLWLRTGDHRDEMCDNKIYLEPSVLENLNKFYNHVTRTDDKSLLLSEECKEHKDESDRITGDKGLLEE